MNRYEATYVYDEPLHRLVERQVYRDYPLRLWRRRILYLGFPLVTVGFGVYGEYLQRTGEQGGADFFWICCAVMLLYSLVVHGLRIYRRSRVIRRRRPGAILLAKQTVVFSDEGVRSDLGEFGRSDMAWISFCRATCTQRLLLVYLSPLDYIAFPREDRSDAEWSVLCREVEEKIGAKQC